MMDLAEYYDLLAQHDWLYEQSDTHSMWMKGHLENRKLVQIARQSSKHTNLLTEFTNYKTGKGTRPIRPVLPIFISTDLGADI